MMSSVLLLLVYSQFLMYNVLGHIESDPPRPNILLLMADDMGWGDLGVNVPNLPSNTPHLDALANEGLRLTDFHTSASVCSPSRAALLTGRLGLRTGVVKNFVPASVAGLPRNETTLAEVLKKAGYRTAMFGKWHLGTQPGFHPIDRGFDEYLGVPYSVDMGCTSPPGKDLPPKDACPTAETSNNVRAGSALALPLYKDRQIIHQPVTLSSLTKRYAEFGSRFIRKQSSAPFFLYGAFSHVHVPLAHGARFNNATGRGLFANTLAEMDWLAGHLVKTAASHGGNSTLTWFLSDNGPWAVKCELAGLNGPFSGDWQRNISTGGGGSAAKRTVWEAGHRVPSFLHWPSKIKGGGVSGALLSSLDVLPTTVELAGAGLPSHRMFDGISFANDLKKTRNIKGHDVLFHSNSGSAGPQGEIGAVRMGRFKTVYYAGGTEACYEPASPARVLSPPLVFDLKVDPSEGKPLSQPELIIQRAENALQQKLNSVRADNTSTADYTEEPYAKPCCSPSLPACACPWD